MARPQTSSRSTRLRELPQITLPRVAVPTAITQTGARVLDITSTRLQPVLLQTAPVWRPVAAFLRWEGRAPQPMLPLRFFKSRAFSATNVVSFAMFFGVFGAIFFLAQFFQTVQGYSALESGLRTLPWTAMPIVVAPIAHGQFPAHEKVIAAKGPKVGQTKRTELLDALRRVSLLSTERSRAIRLTMKPGEIELHASSPDQGEAVETFAAEYSGEQVDIGFNAQYLIEFLSVLSDSDVTVELKDSDSQGIFYPTSQKDGDSVHRYVLMPMRL